MFIAHLPAGYLVSHVLAGARAERRSLVATGLFCSALPDTDLLWFYLLDNRQTPHHEYLFHWPFFWIAVAMVLAGATLLCGRRDLLPYLWVGVVCLLVHLLLDSFAAEIYWFAPFSDWHLNAVIVPARFDWWVWNFVENPQ